jgi:DNA (cytosine-5)-methyltransferase 1
LDVLGIEWDDSTCETRNAAGLKTLKANVAALDPLGFAPVWGFIASAPCPAFSMAGKGEGRAAIDEYRDAMAQMAEGLPVDWTSINEASSNESGHLILEPLRWVLALRPRWVALEQVEPVLPLWESMGDHLRAIGYHVWTGICSAERFGVPQTRRRAILLASLDGPVGEPPATHQRYIAGRVKAKQEDSLFEAPEPERIVLAEEAHLLPWVSMAAALQRHDDHALRKPYGVGMIERGGERRDFPADEPAPTITEKVGRSGTWVQRSNYSDSGLPGETAEQRGRTTRPSTAPSVAVTSKGFQWVHERPAPTIVTTRRSDQGLIVGRQLPPGQGRNVGGHGWVGGQARNSGPGAERDPRPLDAPSYTIRSAGSGSHPSGVEWVEPLDAPACGCRWDWVDAGGFCACCQAHLDDPDGLYALGGGTHGMRECPAGSGRDVGATVRTNNFSAVARDADGKRSKAGSVPYERPIVDPAPTVDTHAGGWTVSRPATTVNGDPRISEPGHHDSDVSGSQQANAVRVSLEEAAILQSFPPDYPWRGSKTKCFEQVGNAVPPLMARAILSMAIAAGVRKLAA